MKNRVVLPIETGIPSVAIDPLPLRGEGECPPDGHAITPPRTFPAVVSCDCGIVVANVSLNEEGRTVIEWDSPE